MCNARALSDCTLIVIEPTVDYGFHWPSREPRVSKGTYHLAKKIRKFLLKVKWNSNFQRWSGTAEISLTSAEPLSSFQSLEVSHQQLTITGNRIANYQW